MFADFVTLHSIKSSTTPSSSRVCSRMLKCRWSSGRPPVDAVGTAPP
jgi:hypothetical protein